MEITQELNDLVFRLARRYIKDPLDEDCAQEVLLDLWRYADFASESMIKWMLRKRFGQLRSKIWDIQEDIDDHTYLVSETEQDMSELYMFVDHKLLTNNNKMFFRFVLEEGVSVSSAVSLSGMKWKNYEDMVEKCREIVDKRRRNNVLYH